MVVCEIAPAVVGLPDDISFGVIHTKKWFPSHAEDVIVGIVALWGGGVIINTPKERHLP